MNSQQIRETFLQYFESRGYTRVESASVVPAGDATLLFTNAGMVPFKQYFLGDKPPYQKAVSSQKCIRAGGKHNDLDQVGFTARHHTFFEMLGNFMFSGADKAIAIQEAWTLITEHYKIPKDRLWVTVFHKDLESREIWHKVIGLPQDRIIDCDEKDNFWSMGDVGPCGPCTEIFYDHGEDVPGGLPGSPDEDGDRYVEIWNLVFMQYEMCADGSRKNLPSLGLDTGMGLERIAAVLQGVHNNFDTDVFSEVLKTIQSIVPEIELTSARVIADHIRSMVFLISDQVYPSNEGRGYVLRRIIRRANGFAYRAGMTKPFLSKLVLPLLNTMGTAYPELLDKQSIIEAVIQAEEEKFLSTVKQGMQRLQGHIEEKTPIDGKTAFEMYDTYGFPLDIIKDIAEQHGLDVDEKGYEDHMNEQRERSRDHQKFSAHSNGVSVEGDTQFLGYEHDHAESKISHIFEGETPVDRTESTAIVVTHESPFYPEGGGEVGDIGKIEGPKGTFIVQDTQKAKKAILHFGYMESGSLSQGDPVTLSVDPNRHQIAANHSATHFLHAALREILGDSVVQKGSLVEADRLRFDFAYGKPLSKAEITQVETRVNEEIQAGHVRERISMPLSEAKKANIMALFDEKYEDPVNVIAFGEFSKELCGGIHVKSSYEIGLFKIISETGIASGVRRIEAVTGLRAIEHTLGQQNLLNELTGILKCDISALENRAEQLMKEHKATLKECDRLQRVLYSQKASEWLDKADGDEDYKLVFQTLENTSPQTLRVVLDSVKSRLSKGLVILQCQQGDQYAVIIGEQGGQYSSASILKQLTEELGGRGGGKPQLAQGVVNEKIEDTVLESILEAE